MQSLGEFFSSLNKKKYPTIEVEADEKSSVKYIDQLLAEKDRRIRDLEQEVESLYMQLIERDKQVKIVQQPIEPEEIPKPVARYVPFSEVKRRLEAHYKERALNNKKKVAK